MSDNRIDIAIGVDGSAVKPGVAEIKREVQSLGNELGKSVADGSAKAVRSVRDLGAQMGNVAGGVTATSRSLDAYIKKIEVSASTIGMSARETKLLELSQRGATAAQLQAADAALKTIEAYKLQQAEARKAAAAAATAAAITSASQTSQAKITKLTADQARQLSFQLNDLFVQIASGQSPITALIQQGSQLNGTFGSMRGTLQAVSTLFTTARVAIGGAAAVVAGFGYAVYEGGQQSAALAKAIALTGNAAGITEGQFNAMASAVAEGTRSTIGSARDALQGLVASGQFSGQALSETAKATQLLAKVTGQSTDDIVKQFVGMADSVGKWAETTNKSYHFLTAEQLDYIKTLEEQGSQQKAIEVAMSALSTRLSEATGKTNAFGDAWSYVKREAGEALDKLLSIGRTSTVDDQIAQLQQKIEFTNKSAGGLTGMSATALAAFNKGASAQLAALQATKAAQEDVVKGNARAIAQENARIKFDDLKEQSLSRQEKLTKELAKANAIADKAGLSKDDPDRLKVLENIREKYKPPKGPASKAPQEAKATLAFDLEAIKKASAAEIDIYTNADKIMEAKRAAQLVDDKQYYAEKMALIQLTSQAQEAALLKEIERMQAEKLSGKDATDNARKIADAQAALAKVRADAKVNTDVTTIQEKGAIDRITKSYDDARIAAQAYIDTVKKQNAREIAGIGKGQQFRDEQAGISQIEDKQTSARQGLEGELRRKEITQKQFDDYLAIVNETYREEVDLYAKRTSDIKALQADGINGATEAIQNYLDGASNMAAQTESLVGNAFHSMEDALVDFATTGKLSFGDLAKSILADLARIQAKNLIASLVGDSKGGAGGVIASLFTGIAGARAEGGPVRAGSNYLVGERGPEIFKAPSSGTIIPNHALQRDSGSPTTNVNVTQNISIDSRTDATTIRQIMQQTVTDTKSQIAAEVARGSRSYSRG